MNREKTQKAEKHTANLQLVKETNLALIFNLIYKFRPVSRAELAKKTKLSPTTVSSLVDELLQKKLVVETGLGESHTSGRKPVLVDINDAGRYIVSVEMMEDGLCCDIYNLLCCKVAGCRRPVKDFSRVGDEIISMLEAVLSERNISGDSLLGINIGVPGLIDYSTNHIVSSTVVPVAEDNEFYRQVRERFEAIPVLLDNESSFCAYAEKEFGIGNNLKQLVYIDVNVGIGAGILLEGRIYRGSFGMAGEIGHMTIDMNGPRCKCGNRGCMELLASIPAMVQKVIFAVMSGRETAIKEMTGSDLNRINAGVIGCAAGLGDELAIEVISENAERLAFGINNVINLYNPQVVVIGGEITKLGGIFIEKLRESLMAISLKPNISNVEIRYSGIEENAATLGGARYMLDNIFSMPALLTEEALSFYNL